MEEEESLLRNSLWVFPRVLHKFEVVGAQRPKSRGSVGWDMPEWHQTSPNMAAQALDTFCGSHVISLRLASSNLAVLLLKCSQGGMKRGSRKITRSKIHLSFVGFLGWVF